MNNPPSPFRLLPTSLKLRRTDLRDRITNILCITLLLLGATALGMNASGEQLLHAAELGNLKEVERLIKQGVSVEAKNRSGWTPLLLAASSGHNNVCRFLIAHNALVEVKNINGLSPLIVAATYGYEDVCELLIENKASVHVQNSHGWTLLLLAARNGHEAVSKVLLANKAVVDAKDSVGLTPLVCAAQEGHEAVCRLLIENGASMEEKYLKGRTSLSWAAFYGHDNVCKCLINIQLKPAKATIITFLGIVKKRRGHLPCDIQKEIAQIIACNVFQLASRRVIEQINTDKPKWLAYANCQMNLL